MKTVIEVINLVHDYGSRRAVNDLSFSVDEGEIVGLLGPNGAGKTTTVRLINGLFTPTSGSIRVLGMDPTLQGVEVRRQTGVLTETPALYERLSAWQNLEFFGTLAGMSKMDCRERSRELLNFFELSERANESVMKYSKGMKQRLALARALLAKPALVFLDEPTSGLDPEAARQVHDLIVDIRARNHQTVLLATHNLTEAARLCDRLAIIHEGRLLALGTLAELRRRVAPGLHTRVELLQPISTGLDGAVTGIAGVEELKISSPVEMIVRTSGKAVLPAVVQALVHNGAQITAVEPHEVPLEEIYFMLQEGVS